MHHRAVIDPTFAAIPLDPLSAIVYGALFILVIAAGLQRLRFAVVALAVTDPFAYPRYVGHTTITLAKVALVASVVAVLVRLARSRFDRRTVWDLRTVRLLWCALGIFAATGLSYVVATDHGAAIRETFKALQYAVVFAVAYAAVRLDDDGPLFVDAMSWTALIVSALALWQLVVGAPSGIWIHDTALPRIAGPLEGPNQLAGYLGLALAIVAAAQMTAPRRLTAAALVVGTLTLFLTLSRTGIITTLVAFAIVIAAHRDVWRRAVLPIVAGSAGGAVVLAAISYLLTHTTGGLSHIVSSVQVEHPGGVGTRAQLWSGALRLWRAHPILGIGAGNFENEVGPLEHAPIRTHANSWYLQSLVEGGVPLIAATLATTYAAIASFGRQYRRDPLVLGAFAGSIGFLLHQLLDDLVFYPKVAVMWWIVLGIACARVAMTQPVSGNILSRAPR